MGKTVRQLTEAGKPVLWLDFTDYAATLLGGANWLDDAAFAAFHARAHSLLRPDVTVLPVERVAHALLAAQPALAQAMAQKPRPGYPLRRLLEEQQLRDTVAALLTPLRAAGAERPLALAIPSPQRWLATAFEAAHGKPLDSELAFDVDEIDGAAVYVADFLRSFSAAGVDTLLLCESAVEAPDAAGRFSLYEPVFKTAAHYRWETGVLDPLGQMPAVSVSGLDFLIAPSLSEGDFGGLLLDDDFWNGAPPAAPVAGNFRYGVVPAGAVPEAVLQRIASLRGA